jgi:ribonucleoside-diphosphate reductase alpha chain
MPTRQDKSEISRKILSDLTTYSKYSKYLESAKRRETWEETVLRNVEMHVKKFPSLENEIYSAYQYVLNKEVLPSMRSLQFGGKPIELMPSRLFNCLGEETEFITSKGLKTFKDFNDGDEVIVPTHIGRWSKAIVRCYGKQKLNKITFHKGRSEKIIYATENHRWITYNGDNTTDLSVGDIIFPTVRNNNFDYDNAEPMEKLYWCYGFVYGDGSLVKSNNITYSMVRLCGADSKFLYRFKEMGFSTSEPNSCHGDTIVYTGKYQKTAPDVSKEKLSMIKAFLDGYLSADGCKNSDWHENNELSKYKSIQSSEKDHFTFLKSALDMCGYYIVGIKELTDQETNYGIRPETYQFSIINKIGSKSNTAWIVSNIEETDRYENVWCLEVENDKSFILSGGLVTGNCSFMAIDDIACFSECMFLLLGGSGVGYSVQKHHISKLPEIIGPKSRTRRYLISDSIEGWADAVKVLVESYFLNKPDPIFDFRDIRKKGARLITSGGKAPGPQPLKDCLHNIRKIFDGAKSDRGVGTKLTSLEAHDILCFIADAVLSGGIRRAALISLFSFDDEDMLTCKFGNWWELNPQRARSNNSAVALRHKIKEKDFYEFWEKVKASNAGEPGIYFTNDKDWGCNPCCEISLRSNGFCNLTTVNVSDVSSQEDLNNRVKAAAFIGTLQASYTDFHYLREIWKENSEKESLLGVSLTGIASKTLEKLDLKQAAEQAIIENKRVAKLIGINPAARITCIKPEGTASCVVGSSSGIHAWHNDYYIRRLRVGKNEQLYSYLKRAIPELVEDDVLKPESMSVVSIPIKAPEGAILRHEGAFSLLERGKKFYQDWVVPGHIKGQNTHNVSITVSIKDDEWESVGKWMWENRNFYNGISVLPYDGGSYVQAPFQDCTEEVYNEMMEKVRNIDLTKVIEEEDNTDLKEQAACAGGACEIK